MEVISVDFRNSCPKTAVIRCQIFSEDSMSSNQAITIWRQLYMRFFKQIISPWQHQTRSHKQTYQRETQNHTVLPSPEIPFLRNNHTTREIIFSEKYRLENHCKLIKLMKLANCYLHASKLHFVINLKHKVFTLKMNVSEWSEMKQSKLNKRNKQPLWLHKQRLTIFSFISFKIFVSYYQYIAELGLN